MNRRALMAGCGSVALLPLALARGQTPGSRLKRIGRLAPLSEATDAANMTAIRNGLAALDWQEGRDYAFEVRYARGRLEALPTLAAELVGAKVDIILAGSNPGVDAAKRATKTVPIVMVTIGDPVAGGLVASLASPGANVTGVTALGQELGGKRLEVLRDAFPGLGRVAVLINPASEYTRPFVRDIAEPARVLGLDIRIFNARTPDEIEPAYAKIGASGAEAIFVLQDGMFIDQRRLITRLSARVRLPAIYGERSFVTDGGLMFYGASLRDMYRQSAGYLDKILKGAKPADIPVQQPTRFSLVVNMKAAKALGLVLPPSFLLRADEVIE